MEKLRVPNAPFVYMSGSAYTRATLERWEKVHDQLLDDGFRVYNPRYSENDDIAICRADYVCFVPREEGEEISEEEKRDIRLVDEMLIATLPSPDVDRECDEWRDPSHPYVKFVRRLMEEAEEGKSVGRRSKHKKTEDDD